MWISSLVVTLPPLEEQAGRIRDVIAAIPVFQLGKQIADRLPVVLEVAEGSQARYWYDWVGGLEILVFALCGCNRGHAVASPGVAITANAPSVAQRTASSRAERPAVQVVAVAARRGDQPQYLDGLGTVTAYNTSTVRTRVDGPLTKIAFR